MHMVTCRVRVYKHLKREIISMHGEVYISRTHVLRKTKEIWYMLMPLNQQEWVYEEKISCNYDVSIYGSCCCRQGFSKGKNGRPAVQVRISY
jgi:hypothetical protein